MMASLWMTVVSSGIWGILYVCHVNTERIHDICNIVYIITIIVIVLNVFTYKKE